MNDVIPLIKIELPIEYYFNKGPGKGYWEVLEDPDQNIKVSWKKWKGKNEIDEYNHIQDAF